MSLPVYFCGPPAAPAQHLGNQVFESCRRYLVVRIVNQGIGIEPPIGHHAVDEVVHDGRDAVDTTTAWFNQWMAW